MSLFSFYKFLLLLYLSLKAPFKAGADSILKLDLTFHVNHLPKINMNYKALFSQQNKKNYLRTLATKILNDRSIVDLSKTAFSLQKLTLDPPKVSLYFSVTHVNKNLPILWALVLVPSTVLAWDIPQGFQSTNLHLSVKVKMRQLK